MADVKPCDVFPSMFHFSHLWRFCGHLGWGLLLGGCLMETTWPTPIQATSPHLARPQRLLLDRTMLTYAASSPTRYLQAGPPPHLREAAPRPAFDRLNLTYTTSNEPDEDATAVAQEQPPPAPTAAADAAPPSLPEAVEAAGPMAPDAGPALRPIDDFLLLFKEQVDGGEAVIPFQMPEEDMPPPEPVRRSTSRYSVTP